MKSYLRSFCVGALITCACAGSRATPLINGNDEWGRAEIQMPSGRKTLAEMLSLYSRTAQANVFADVSDVALTVSIDSPADFMVSPTQKIFLSRSNGIGRIAFEGKMWSDRNDSNTYVLWSQPDTQKLIRLIVEQQQKFEAATPMGDRAATITSLKDFYAREKGWNAKAVTEQEKIEASKGVNGSLPISAFPMDLQGPLTSELVYRLRMLESSYEPATWTQDYWKNAKVRLHVPTRSRTGKLLPNVYGGAPTVDVQFRPDCERSIRGFTVGQPQQIKVDWPSRVNPPLRLLAHAFASRPSLCAPATDTPTIAPQPPLPGFGFDSAQETALQKTVAFAHQSVALNAIIADLSKQTGVALQLKPDVAPNAKAIAISGGMTLASAMSALARLYNGHWQKDGSTYSLQSNQLDQLHMLMSHMGQCAYYSFLPRESKELAAIGNDLAGQIVDSCDAKQLASPEGVLFSSLPSDIQQGVITLMSEENQGDLIVSQQRLDDALASGVQLRFAPRPANAPQFFGAFYTGGAQLNGTGDAAILAAYTSDGRYITRLFPEFVVAPLSRSEAVAKQRGQHKRQGEAQTGEPNIEGTPLQ